MSARKTSSFVFCHCAKLFTFATSVNHCLLSRMGKLQKGIPYQMQRANRVKATGGFVPEDVDVNAIFLSDYTLILVIYIVSKF